MLSLQPSHGCGTPRPAAIVRLATDCMAGHRTCVPALQHCSVTSRQTPMRCQSPISRRIGFGWVEAVEHWCSADSLPRTHAGMSASAFRRHRLCAAALTGVAITTTATALLPQLASARPWPIPQSRWSNSVQDYPEPSAPPRPWWNSQAKDGYQSYDRPPLTPEQQAQRCNTGRLIGGLGGGAVAYAMSRDDGRAWAIPLGALLGSQVGCNTAAGRGPLPW